MYVSTNFFIQCKCYNGIDTFTNNCCHLKIYSEDQQHLYAPLLQPTVTTPDERKLHLYRSQTDGSSFETWLPMWLTYLEQWTTLYVHQNLGLKWSYEVFVWIQKILGTVLTQWKTSDKLSYKKIKLIEVIKDYKSNLESF